jgi:propanol-preferring alcohol dehydrogenase
MLLDFPAPIREAPLHPGEIPPPAPGPGQVLVKVSACAVCQIDLQTVEGTLPLERLPLIPGHQVVGRVAETGPGAKRFWGGERVGLGWLFHACGDCSFCKQDREHLCTQAEFTGLHRDGGLAEFVVAFEDFLHPLPDGLADEVTAPLLGVGLLAYRALGPAGLEPGSRLGIFGFGAEQQAALALARFWDWEVYVFTRSAAHQKLAREQGAAWAGHPEEPPPTLMDRAVVFAPAAGMVPVALSILSRGGDLSLAGLHLEPLPTLGYERHLVHEKAVRAVMGGSRRDVQEFLELAGQIPLVSEVKVFPLQEANEALRRLKTGQTTGTVVLKPGA